MNDTDFSQFVFPRAYDQDLYKEHRDLASPLELEDWDFDERFARIPTFPAAWKLVKLKLSESYTLIADAMGRSDWEKRSPALGLNEKCFQVLEQHLANPLLLDVQRRQIFRYLRVKMLQQLICCSGAGSVDDLCKILRAELTCGVPAPAPSWYVFSTLMMGPRKIGYYPCSNRGCLVTESVESAPFKKCSRCRLAWYCSEKCQASDWVARHSVVCNESTKSCLKSECAKACIQRITDGKINDLPSTGSKSYCALLGAFSSPEVASGIFQWQADLKKEQLRTPGTEVQTPLAWCGERSDCVSAFKIAFIEQTTDGDLPSTQSNSLATLDSWEVASRSSQRRADSKKEEKLKASGTDAPTPLSRYMPSSATSSHRRSLLESAVFARTLVSRSDLNERSCVINGSVSEASGRGPIRFHDSGEEELN